MRVLPIFVLIIGAVPFLFGEGDETATPVALDTSFLKDNGTSLDGRIGTLVGKIENSYSFVSPGEEASTDGEKPVWTEKHNEVFREVYQNCGPSGNGSSVINCEQIGFGLNLVDQSAGSSAIPGFKSNEEIAFEEFSAHPYMHMDLTVSAVGTSKVLDKLIEYNLNMVDGEESKAADVFTQDPELKRQVEDAAKQPDRYMGIVGRTTGSEQVVSPPYNGNLGDFLTDQYFMADRQKKALVATLNSIQYLTQDEEDRDADDLYSNKILGSDGRILSSTIEDQLREGGKLYLPSDGTIEAVVEQLDSLGSEFVDLESEDPFAGLREFLEQNKDLDENEDLQSLIEERTFGHMVAIKSDDEFGFQKYGARLINEDGISSICKRSGKKGYGIPLTGNSECQKSFLKGYEEFEPGFKDSEAYVDSTNGRFSEDLLLEKITEKRKNLQNSISTENSELFQGNPHLDEEDPLEKYLLVKSRDSAIKEFAQIDIRNNPELFAKSTSLLGSQGVVKPSDSERSDIIAQAENEYGPGGSSSGVSFAISSMFDTPGDGFNSGGSGSLFSGDDSAQTPEDGETRREIDDILGSSDIEVKDTTISDSSDDDPFANAFAFSSSAGSSDPSDESGGVGYRNQNENDRGNLLKFPEALIEPDVLHSDGKPRMNQAVGIFCNPTNFVLKDDPKCRCLHGPKIKVFYDEQDDLDCPGQSFAF